MESNVTITSYEVKEDFYIGLKKAMPIALGYFPVSFTFGMMATRGGIHPMIATVISLTNLTSAGQFAGTSLILANAPIIEIMMTTFIINIRYMLMSLALTQKLQSMSIIKKMILAFGITDEIFALASLEDEKISFVKIIGMIAGPYIGWGLGTFSGAYMCTLLSSQMQQAMGIALYAMFLALIVPEMKKQKSVLLVVLFTIMISLIFWYIPVFDWFSEGWKIILTTIIGSLMGAWVFPREEALDE
ncbi:MAG: AzlC family ABC transporter permease [Cellulosilyticaceae bacterium]